MSDYRAFEEQTLCEKLAGSFHWLGRQLFLLPNACPDLGKVKVVRAGLHLGEQKRIVSNRTMPWPWHCVRICFKSVCVVGF
ncbi:tRNA/RNA cytosine-C5-methylase [Sporolactobacillus inulinus]|uniref:tRNA/RNA cytosine-C5-methylase n=1 Tax=Sporolactobacillus inulinus TaxID=2078 RepID=A0A4Y1ZEJ6_9BACL|nr:tRNA/RNA cytosine-C5-methylase [Sporolactobacillus inulinus]